MEITKSTATYARIRVEASAIYNISGSVVVNNEGSVMPMAETKTGAISNGIVKTTDGVQVASFTSPSESSLNLNLTTNDTYIRQAVLEEVQQYCSAVRSLIEDNNIIITPKAEEE